MPVIGILWTYRPAYKSIWLFHPSVSAGSRTRLYLWKIHPTSTTPGRKATHGREGPLHHAEQQETEVRIHHWHMCHCRHQGLCVHAAQQEDGEQCPHHRSEGIRTDYRHRGRVHIRQLRIVLGDQGRRRRHRRHPR